MFLKTSASLGLALALMLVMSATVLARESPEQREARRRKAPDCESLPEKTRRVTEICKTDEERREDEYQKRVAEQLEREKPTKTSFLKWLHFDGLWAPTVWEGGTLGLVGTHVTIADIGRVNLFGPPGVMLLIENHDGARSIRPAITWGISVYLVDFHPPGTTNTARLFLNLAKAQTFGGQRTGMDLAGLSVTWKK